MANLSFTLTQSQRSLESDLLLNTQRREHGAGSVSSAHSESLLSQSGPPQLRTVFPHGAEGGTNQTLVSVHGPRLRGRKLPAREKDANGSPALPFADGGQDQSIRGGHFRSELPCTVGGPAGRQCSTHSPHRAPTWADPRVARHVAPRVTPAGMAAPSMKERQACWGARDLYWRCLDDNAEDAARCQKLRSSFEASCPQQWVSPAGLQRVPVCTLTSG